MREELYKCVFNVVFYLFWFVFRVYNYIFFMYRILYWYKMLKFIIKNGKSIYLEIIKYYIDLIFN